jgi:ribosomal protein S18 acetylase RimI-like enzyme
MFEPPDRGPIRDMTHLVGYMGEPADWYWRHAKSFADVWTSYYTDQEPESLLVALEGQRIVGYLTGCVDSRRAPSPAWAITRADLRYALYLRPGTAGFFWRGVLDTVVQRGTPKGQLDDPRWPSHLHINLLPEARGAGVGDSLMNTWLTQLQQLGSPGCHLGTLLENDRAIRFFERQGFERFGAPQLAPGMRTPSGGRHHLQFMVRNIPAV